MNTDRLKLLARKFDQEVKDEKDTKGIYKFIKKEFPKVKMRYKTFVVAFTAMLNSPILAYASENVDDFLKDDYIGGLWAKLRIVAISLIVVGVIKEIVDATIEQNYKEILNPIIKGAYYIVILMFVPSMMKGITNYFK